MNNLDFEYLKYRYGKENLSDIFNVNLDLFPSVKTNKVTGKQINLYELLFKIKYNLAEDITPDILLTYKYVKGERNPEYDKKKILFPSVCYNANFEHFKELKYLKSITNLMYLDIDGFESKEEVNDYKKEIIKKYDWILACYHSLSRLGLHIIVKVDKIYNNDDYNNKYDFVSKEYFNGLLDKSAKSLARYTIIPFDYNIYINENPTILEIDQEYEKSTRSGNKEKKIIYTPCTFSGDLNTVMNKAATEKNLRFKLNHDESMFMDKNIPIHSHEGFDVIEVNLYPLYKNKVYHGNRNNTIGAISMQMIYLNANNAKKEDIFRFIVTVNKMICSPPLTYKEVKNSFESNWRKYENLELDISKCYRRKKSLWSTKCTLSGNEKRKITCALNRQPEKERSRRLIYESIEEIYSNGIKITQKKVQQESGLAISTVKNYWKEFKEMVKEMNSNL